MKKSLFLIILLFINGYLISQSVTKPLDELEFFKDTTANYNSSYGGNVVVTADAKLEKIIYNYKLAYKSQPQVYWKVQIYFGTGASGRAAAQSIRNKFSAKYPKIPSEIIFQEPYFKVRVGKYENKFDAQRLKAQLNEEYNKIFIVEDIKN